MKVLICSRHFPKWHPKAGQPTYFVEQILSSILPRPLSVGLHEFPAAARGYINDFMVIDGLQKNHTIRPGSRFKVGEMVSLRIWSDKPYRSKQIEFAQVEVKKVWSIEINNRFGAASFEVVINGVIYSQLHYGNDKDVNKPGLIMLAKNDGLELDDFTSWFEMHPKKTGLRFAGQIVCWSDSIEYGTPSLHTEKNKS